MPESQRILHLYGATSQNEILTFLRTQCVFEAEDEIETIMAEWPKAAQEYQRISLLPNHLAETAGVEDIPEENSEKLKEISNDPPFRATFSYFPYAFKMVELDKLVAAQRYVNLDYVERLSHAISKDSSIGSLIDFCLRKGSSVKPPSELQINQNTYSYRSESVDFRFIGGFPKKLTQDDIKYSLGGGEPVAGILLFVGYGTPAINVFQVGKRLILNNGFHRLYALRKQGILKAPVVIQTVANWNLELPQVVAGLPAVYLVTAPNPSLLQDFLNPEISRELRMKSRDRSVQIQWAVNQVDIPK